MASNAHKVGIFSRDGRDNYNWLYLLLLSGFFKSVVTEVHPIYIANNNFHQFMNNVTQCTFAILYHSRKRGRLNVTNVTDSLYDMELEHLSTILGKKRVIVVMDDVENSSPEEKKRILQDQYSIGQLACDLFLFSEQEKRSCNMYASDPIWSERPTSNLLHDEYNSVVKKRKEMKEIVAGHKDQHSRDDPRGSQPLIRSTSYLNSPTDIVEISEPRAPNVCKLSNKNFFLIIIASIVVLIICLIVALTVKPIH